MSLLDQECVPAKLYKFRAFSPQTLHLLNQERVYYSDPTTFNDPLDCKPIIKGDVSTEDLVRLCHLMGGHPVDQTAFDGEPTPAECPDLDATGDDFYRRLLLDDLSRLLQADLGKHGVLSLTARWNSPLMWSHYADQHRGFCIEYDTTKLKHPTLHAVDYGAPRSIPATNLLEWKANGSLEAEANVRKTYFLAKAIDWKYEDEWRLIHDNHGEDVATLKVTGIYFGMRCPLIVRSIFIHILSPLSNFNEVYATPDSFELDSQVVNPSEEIEMARGSSAYLEFADYIPSHK